MRTAGWCSTLRTSGTRPGEAPPHSCQNNLSRQALWEAEKGPPCTVAGGVNPRSHYGNTEAMPQKTEDCPMIREFHFWAFSGKKKKARTLIQKNKSTLCYLLQYLQ